jgi:cytochrome c peroxidase
MVEDPFLTVDLTTNAQKRGKKVFKNQCFACHNTPQVFSALDNVEPLANGDRPPQFPSWAPAVGKTYNIGVAEANFHNLRFTRFVAPDDFEDIVLELANEDGSIEHVTAEFDLGLAMTTGRTEDVGRFKVPQLRNLVNNGPYMHDNSLATIEDVVNYKCSADYNDSKDGQYFPIGLTSDEKADLIEFLYAL